VAPGQPGSDVVERILQRDEEMADAVVAGDLGRLEDICADDYLHVS
jgi:hypothetical protein